VADPALMRIRLSQLSLHRPRQWGACWLTGQLWEQLGLDQFWAARLPPSRKGTRWDWVLQILVAYRLLDPGSEWRLYRHWFEHSAMADLLGADLELADIHKLYECHERLLEHKRDLFTHLAGRWKDLFNAHFEVLLYDLTSTYFESDPPFPEGDKRRYGYSRDKRPDCVQVVIALIVTPEGFPLAYEVLAGNTSDKTTLADFLKRIEDQYGRAERIWVMDRGIPTEKILEQMRATAPPVQYLVGTPRGRLSQYEQKLAGLPWQVAREGVSVKLLEEGQELYVLAESKDRVNKERAMRRRQLKGLWHRLKKLQGMKLKRDELLKKLGAALHEYPVAARLIDTTVAPQTAALTFTLRKDKLRQSRKREGRYLLRSNITAGRTPEELWQFYIQLTEVEAAFKSLKDDLSLRPIYHQLEHRIEAHIFISFLA
jgi:transposase